jgi:hypothetical protein
MGRQEKYFMGGQRSISWEGKKVIYRKVEGYFIGRQEGYFMGRQRGISWEGKRVIYRKAKE